MVLQQSYSEALGEENESSNYIEMYLGFAEHCLDCFARCVGSLETQNAFEEFRSWHTLRMSLGTR